MSQIKNSMPRVEYKGFKDDSVPPPLSVVTPVPQHCPIVYMFAAKGDTRRAYYGSLSDHLRHLGDDTFNNRSKFFGPAQRLAQVFGSQSFFIKRMEAPGSKTAKVVVLAEVVEAEVPQYSRDGDGKIERDTNGDPLPSTSTVDGFKVKLSTMTIDDSTDIDSLQVTPGTLSGKAGATSKIYPLYAWECDPGESGNMSGVRIYTPGEEDPLDYNERVVEDFNSILHRVQFFTKNNDNFIRTVETTDTTTFVDFCLKEGAYDKLTNVDYTYHDVISRYETTSLKEVSVPQYGPFRTFKVFEENISTVLNLIVAQERTHSGNADLDPYMVNLLGGKYPDGKELYAVEYDANSKVMDDNTIIFATGGKDGQVDWDTADARTRFELDEASWRSVDFPLVDDLQYPISALWDIGYSMETKNKMIKLLSVRRDIAIFLSTYTFNGPTLSIAEESSVIATLFAKIAMHPESTFHNTDTCRAVVIQSSCKMVNDTWRKRVPLTFDLAAKVTADGGAESGELRPNAKYNRSPNNEVTLVEDVSNPFQPKSIRSKNWTMGANYVQYKNMNTLFYPGLQTVYKNQRSVLNNMMLMLIGCDVVKRAHVCWAEVTGDDATKEEFSDRTNEIFGSLINNRYDNRVRIEYDVEFTALDDNNGYSWTLDVKIYGSPGYTVQNLNIAVRRFTS